MSTLFLALERASLFGLAALCVALLAQWVLDGRVPASWRVWVWRVALLQTTLSLVLALLPLSPLHLAVLPPQSLKEAPTLAREKSALPMRVLPMRATFSKTMSAPSGSSSPPASASRPALSSAPIFTAPAEDQVTSDLQVLVSARHQARRFSVETSLVALYAVGLGVQLLWLARSFGRLRVLLRTCAPVENAGLRVALSQNAQRMGVSPLPKLLQSEGAAPFLVGILRPAIVVPRLLLGSRSAELEAVLSHELAHLKRHDLAWNALLWLVQSLLWFHPLTWVSRRFLALETESACDEMVLRSTRISPQSYGALLLNTLKSPTTPLTAGIADGFFALKTRLVRLNQAPKRPRRGSRLAFVIALCLSVGAAVPLRFVARAQQAPAAKTGAAKGKIRLVPGSYRVQGNVPRDATPEALVGLPARLEDARGNATISGRVVDYQGKPIAGAKISTFCVWVAQTELWGYHRTQANHYRWPDKIDKLLSGVTTTRADGTYRFTGLLPQWYHIHLRGDNYGNRAPAGYTTPVRGVGVTAVASRTVRAPDTVLQRSAQIRIRAIDQDTGAPLEGVVWRGFIVNEAQNPTGWAVDAHQGDRPFKGLLAERATDKDGYCTLDLNSGKAYFFMSGGLYKVNTSQDKSSKKWSAFPSGILTTQGLYEGESWCQVTALAPQIGQAAQRSWKGETELQLKKGPAANFVVRLKRYKPLTPQYRARLQLIKRHF